MCFAGKIVRCSVCRRVASLSHELVRCCCFVVGAGGAVCVFAAGDNGDRTAFCQYVQKNATLYRLRNDITLSTDALAHWTRRALADALRKHPYQANLLLAGWDEPRAAGENGAADESGGASLYFIDYLASMQRLPFACQGYAGHFLLGLLDNQWRPDMTRDEARALLDQCIEQLQQRFVLGAPQFAIKLVDRDGIHVLESGE